MKKTIAAILVAVIAGLASPTVFAHGIAHFPTKAEIQAQQHQRNQGPSFWDKIADLWHGIFG
jgi:hypothetical protein